MPGTDATAFSQLQALILGYRASDAIHTAARLDIASALRDGPRTASQIAAQGGLDAPALYRLLRTLAACGIFEEGDGEEFTLTEMGRLLLPDEPGSLRASSLLSSAPYFREAWNHLEDSVHTGKNTFRLVNDTDVWSWRADHPEENAIFNAAMAGPSHGAARAVARAYDFSVFRSAIDVGGGDGTLMLGILGAYEGLQGAVFDQPHVVSAAAPKVAEAGLAERCQIIPGSFFESVPPGFDCYLMKHILHDWTDDECLKILAKVRAACGEESRLLVLELVIGPPNTDAAGKLSDLNMLVMPGGRERTEPEWRSLLAAGGFRVRSIVPTTAAGSVIEAEPAA